MRHTFACPSAKGSLITKNTCSQLSADSKGQELSPLDVAPGVAVVNSNYQYLSINATLAAMHGRSIEEHIGRSVVDAVQQSVHHLLLPAYREVITTGIAVENVMVEAFAGPHLKRCVANYYPVKVGDGPLWGVQVVAKEVTTTKSTLLDTLQLCTLSLSRTATLALVDEPTSSETESGLPTNTFNQHLSYLQAPSRPLCLAIKYMNDQYVDPKISLSVISRRANISERHLSRLFQKSFGKTFHQCVRNLRMNKAAELLLHSDYDIKVIAGMVGYNCCSRFCDDFRRSMGRTAVQFRTTFAGRKPNTG